LVKKLSRYEVSAPKAMRFRFLNISFVFIWLFWSNGAKHSSWFRSRYGEDGWRSPWPEFVRLVTFSKIWKIKWGSFPETILLQVNISLWDVLKMKWSENKIKHFGTNPHLHEKSVPKLKMFVKKWSFPISSWIISMMFWDINGVKKHSFRLNSVSGNPQKHWKMIKHKINKENEQIWG